MQNKFLTPAKEEAQANHLLRRIWRSRIPFNPLAGTIFIILFGVARYLMVIEATVTGSSRWLPMLFLLMIVVPVILLNKNGRRSIGLKKPTDYRWIVFAFLAGLAACFILYALNLLLFQKSLENAIVYIARSYDSALSAMRPGDRHVYFIIYAAIGMTVSPFGEEIFFRGFIHENFAGKWGNNHASDADSVAFAVTHLIHFGFVYVSGQWSFYFAAATVWLTSMYVVSKLFFYCREKSGSIYGAVAAHSGFNLAMTWLIFYQIQLHNLPQV